MPILTPTEVRNRTSFLAVKNRTDQQLADDILEAESYIEAFTNTTFSSTVPEKVRVACIKLAQYYALFNASEAMLKGYESEQLKDYQYKIGKDATFPDVTHLLTPYIVPETENPTEVTTTFGVSFL